MIERVSHWLQSWQQGIASMLQSEDPSLQKITPTYPFSGGGHSLSIRLFEGDLIEKAGISFSHIQGNRLPKSATDRRPELANHPFEVTGVSVVIHPRHPHIPTTHANLRFFSVHNQCSWFGGGFDLTPYIGYESDARLWHQSAKKACDRFNPHCYAQFKAHCDAYFYSPHRDEHRGIGGIFFDDLMANSEAATFQFIQDTGQAFHQAYHQIIQRRKQTPFSPEEQQFMHHRRGRYAEFNLLHDRGTRFGLESGANAEAILMSMPPTTHWLATLPDALQKREQALIANYLTPKDWAHANALT